MAKFLDENGVKKLWSRIQEYIYECGCNNCSGGDVDVGYECKNEELFNASGATEVVSSSNPPMYSLSYSDYIDADKVIVVLNGTEYVCKRQTNPNNTGASVYGASSLTFSDYPFALVSQGESGNTLLTKQPMDFTIEVSLPTTTVTPCFEAAVKVAIGDSKGVKVIHIEKGEGSRFVCDTSCDEMVEILQSGGYVVAFYQNQFFNLYAAHIALTPKTSSSSIRSNAPLLRSKEGGPILVFARIDIDPNTQQAEKIGFIFDTDDCSITPFPSFS